MSVQAAFEFTVAAAKDPALAAEVSAAIKGKSPEASASAFAAAGASKGYQFTAAEAAEMRASFQQVNEPLSDNDLNTVAGGITGINPPFIGSWEDLGMPSHPIGRVSRPPLGQNPATWGPGNQMPGSNPATWGPGNTPLGNDPATWSPRDRASDFLGGW